MLCTHCTLLFPAACAAAAAASPHLCSLLLLLSLPLPILCCCCCHRWLQVSKRLGPVGLAKVVAKLGPRGVLNLASHILSRMADHVRAQSAHLNPKPHHHHHSHHNHNPGDQGAHLISSSIESMTEPEEEGFSSSGGTGRTGSSRGVRRGGGVSPAVGLLVALVQLVLAAVAGEDHRGVWQGVSVGGTFAAVLLLTGSACSGHVSGGRLLHGERSNGRVWVGATNPCFG